jgi:hypothetical protein
VTAICDASRPTDFADIVHHALKTTECGRELSAASTQTGEFDPDKLTEI